MKQYGPKPLIEEHHHIADLIEGQERRAADRTHHQNRIKNAEEREEEIGKSQVVMAMDFHCAECREDFKAVAVLQVEADWSNANQRIAFYKTKHRKCGNWCIRLVTDKNKDGFFVRSRVLAQDRGKYHNDIVQPWEEGFNMLYGKR